MVYELPLVGRLKWSPCLGPTWPGRMSGYLVFRTEDWKLGLVKVLQLDSDLMFVVLSVVAPKPSPTGDFALQSFGTGLQVTGGGNPLALGHQVNNTLLMGANSLLNNSGRTNFTNKQLTELEKVSSMTWWILRVVNRNTLTTLHPIPNSKPKINSNTVYCFVVIG